MPVMVIMNAFREDRDFCDLIIGIIDTYDNRSRWYVTVGARHFAPRRFAPVYKRCFAPDSMRHFATCST